MEQNLKKLQQDMKQNYEQPELSKEQVSRLKQRMEQAKEENRKDRQKKTSKKILAVAASVVIMVMILPNTSATVANAMQQIPFLGEFIKLVTVREYEYEDERHMAKIQVGELVLEDITAVENLDTEVKKTLQRTLEEINKEMVEIADWMMEGFEESLEREETQALTAKGSLIPTTEQYLVVELACIAAGGSGIQWNYYYTIDLTTGKQMTLEELFLDGADFITPIKKNIEDQMKKQMAEDENKSFYFDGDWGIDLGEEICEEEAFYINELGNIVICFDEGDVAPMYMGALKFEIENTVLADIRK